jgi:hypothetical protein
MLAEDLHLITMWGRNNIRNSAQTKSTTPIRDLSHGNRIHTLVDTLDTLFPVDIHECGHSARHLLALHRRLMLRHLHSLHARAETHGRVCLRKTTSHTTSDTGDEVGSTEALCVVLSLGGDEEEDGTLGGCFDPGPGDETLVDWTREIS